VDVADGDGTAILRVTDSCGGIPEADLPRVFDQLWRGDPARSTKGAGLGLAIARGLIDAHDGTIGWPTCLGAASSPSACPGPPTYRPRTASAAFRVADRVLTA
jgi:C4-dicarboxylate-specific signal transduction histidine kinase